MKNKIGIIVCLHGTETSGLKVKQKLKGAFSVFLGNPRAVANRVRFIDSDLNRVFPGNPKGNYEERLAFELLEKLKKLDYVIDLHTSECNFPLFGIITKPTTKKVEFAKKLGLKKLVIMNDQIARGGALIDYLNCAISLEVGPHSRSGNVQDFIETIKNFPQKSKRNMEIYRVYDFIKGEKDVRFFVENFQEVKKGTLIAKGKINYFAKEDFIPVFVGKSHHDGRLCLVARKVDLKN